MLAVAVSSNEPFATDPEQLTTPLGCDEVVACVRHSLHRTAWVLPFMTGVATEDGAMLSTAATPPDTTYEVDSVIVLPALSVAVTSKTWPPGEDVSSVEPLGCVPRHCATPDPSVSSQAKLTTTPAWFSANTSPSAGRLIQTCGGVTSPTAATS